MYGQLRPPLPEDDLRRLGYLWVKAYTGPATTRERRYARYFEELEIVRDRWDHEWRKL